MPGVLKQKLLLFDADSTTFRSISLRPSRPDCAVCGANPQITNLIDYEEFCGARATDKDSGIDWLKPEQRITPAQLKDALSDNNTVVIDVRSKEEFDMCSLSKSVNIPWTEFTSAEKENALRKVKSLISEKHHPTKGNSKPILDNCICLK